ncbi:uncharacterized protein LOC108051194 [Drosophila rhopaloa]|uniref:Uncharacterized protein LOC108051194 n=1 Tax=Drosophila rhopaloa TaxID=1041015 RepID=A0A6P4FMI9_DRORH|nr:uncharacterized protein LOC108051194 [Drosophila rhopaloa]
MPITRRLSWPKLLFLFVWLCLALDRSYAARVSSDLFVFPSKPNESKPNDTTIQTRSRLEEIARIMALINTPSDGVLMPKEIKKGTPRTTDSENESEKPGNTPVETRNVTEPNSSSSKQEINVKDTPTTPMNGTHQSSESKMITFGKESEEEKPAPWHQTEATIASKPGSVVIGPRITLETLRICPEGTTLSNDHCRKIA